MRIKVVIVTLYLALASTPAGQFRPARAAAEVSQPADVNSQEIVLDKTGPAGPVNFNHRKHESAINPDPAAAHRANAGAACAGCHHNARSIPRLEQYQRCSVCHRERGNERNPRSRTSDEMWVKAAYHLNCIGCHQASHKGPTKCGDCHRKAAA